MIDVHQNAALSESFEGDRSRVIGNRCKLQSRLLQTSINLCYTGKGVGGSVALCDQIQVKSVTLLIEAM